MSIFGTFTIKVISNKSSWVTKLLRPGATSDCFRQFVLATCYGDLCFLQLLTTFGAVMLAWGAGNAMKAGRAQLLKLGVTFESFESMEEQCNGSREGLQCF